MFYLLFWAMAWASGDVEINAKLKTAKVESGSALVLVIELYVPSGWDNEYSGPSVQGLDISPPTSSKRVVVGERWRQVLQFSLSGSDGSYIIEPGTLSATLPDGTKAEKKAPKIYADIEEGPSSELQGLHEPPDVSSEESSIWIVVLSIGGVIVLLAIAYVFFRRKKPKLTPSQQALKDWELARNQISDDHGLAIALSSILRRYIDVIFNANTINCSPNEAKQWLESSPVPVRFRQNAVRIFDATNRLKFARDGGGGPFFDSLNKDFFRFIKATEPKDPK